MGRSVQALNDGHGFFTGTDPVGITVADLNGDGRLDLIIANQGSNDVSILINVKVGNSFTFVQGPRAPGGRRAGLDGGRERPRQRRARPRWSPTAARTTCGCSQAIGNGFFNDQSPTIYPVGTDPSALFVGQFTTGSGQDLVTVNSGSNNLTLISGLGTASPLMQSISSGGIDPIGGLRGGSHGQWSGQPGGRQQRRRQYLAVPAG